MSMPRKVVEAQKARLSKTRKAKASTKPLPLGKPVKSIPAEVAGDPVAREKWTAIFKAYSEAGYVPTLGDIEALTRLCFLYSEMADIRQKLPTAVDDMLELHKLLDSKRRLALPLEDRLLLNPVARMRGLPPVPEKKAKTPLQKAGFDI